ncbi:hypothetical protein OFO16_03005 [Vibrio natriegens]|uniref:hypothetical protein n=1 Tax=Vibrio natriegens TaxID=691 RepID=UPI0021E7310B|nr:hypothetical protein [Vibrio natriegens]UYI48659.1 hypothetical protein OFO16_03005 [Vibrio natriegens]
MSPPSQHFEQFAEAIGGITFSCVLKGSDHRRVFRHKYTGQFVDVLAGVKTMNKVIGLGMPIRQLVSDERQTQ